MQIHNLGRASEMISHASYDPQRKLLYLTYHRGPTTVAYNNVEPNLFDALRRSAYPDVCIKFNIQATHSCLRLPQPHEYEDLSFIK